MYTCIYTCINSYLTCVALEAPRISVLAGELSQSWAYRNVAEFCLKTMKTGRCESRFWLNHIYSRHRDGF